MVIAIPASKLGILEHQFKMLGTYKLKRERKQEGARLERVLKDLRLIERKFTVTALSYGVDGTGELFAFVSNEVDLRHQGEIIT